MKVDKTNPTISFPGQTPVKNSYGWNKTNVDLNWSCSDVLSGAAAASVSKTIATEGQNQQATGTCLDVAGNSSSSVNGKVNIDKTSPTLNITGA